MTIPSFDKNEFNTSLLAEKVYNDLTSAQATTDVLTAREPSSAASVAEHALFRLTGSGTIVGAYYVPDVSSAPAAGSNSQAIVLGKGDGAGGARATVASASIANATPAAAFANFSLGAITNGAYTNGQVVTVSATLTGTATLPAGTWCLVVRPTLGS